MFIIIVVTVIMVMIMIVVMIIIIMVMMLSSSASYLPHLHMLTVVLTILPPTEWLITHLTP